VTVGARAPTSLPPKPLAAVLFDIGGTLLEYVPEASPAGRRNLREGCRRAYEWLQEHGKPVPDFPSFLKKHWRALSWARFRRHLWGEEFQAQSVVLRALARMGVQVLPQEICELTECYYRTFGETLSPMEGAGETLGALAGLGLRAAAVSNTAWPGYLIEGDLDRFGLLGYMDFCLFSSYYGLRKPREEIFCEALRMLGVTAGEAVFVGDNLKQDIGGAKRVGMRTVLVVSERTGNQSSVPHRRTIPEWTIRELPELIGIVEELRRDKGG